MGLERKGLVHEPRGVQGTAPVQGHTRAAVAVVVDDVAVALQAHACARGPEADPPLLNGRVAVCRVDASHVVEDPVE